MKTKNFESFTFLKHYADQILYFDRNEEDSFVFDLINLNKNPKISLTKNELSFLLPSGSKWKNVLGWRSIFCIPLVKSNSFFFALGVEKIVSHKSRGAYPISHIYIFQDIVTLYKALKKIRAKLFNFKIPKDLKCEYNGILRVNCGEPNSFEKYEKWILKCAEKKYSINEPILFRTIILTETHLSQIKSTGISNFFSSHSNPNQIIIKNVEYLIGSSKKLEISLSSKAKLRLNTMKKIPCS